MKDRPLIESGPTAEAQLPQYEPPRIRLMDEEEVLSSFQVTQASLSWWFM